MIRGIDAIRPNRPGALTRFRNHLRSEAKAALTNQHALRSGRALTQVRADLAALAKAALSDDWGATVQMLRELKKENLQACARPQKVDHWA